MRRLRAPLGQESALGAWMVLLSGVWLWGLALGPQWAATTLCRWIQLCRNFWPPLQWTPLGQQTLQIFVREGVPLTSHQTPALPSGRTRAFTWLTSLWGRCLKNHCCHFSGWTTGTQKSFLFTGVLEKLQLAGKGSAAACVGLSHFSLHSLLFFRGK